MVKFCLPKCLEQDDVSNTRPTPSKHRVGLFLVVGGSNDRNNSSTNSNNNNHGKKRIAVIEAVMNSRNF